MGGHGPDPHVLRRAPPRGRRPDGAPGRWRHAAPGRRREDPERGHRVPLPPGQRLPLPRRPRRAGGLRGAPRVARGRGEARPLRAPARQEKEIWNGRRAGVEGAKERYGADEAYTVAELDEKLPALIEGAETLWFQLGHEPAWDARLARILRGLRSGARLGKRPPRAIVDPGRILHELRLVKSPEELEAAPQGGGDHRRGAHGGDARRPARAARVPGAGGDRVRVPPPRRLGPGLRHDRRGRRELDHPPLPRRTRPR